jgi:hypothetical protein
LNPSLGSEGWLTSFLNALLLRFHWLTESDRNLRASRTELSGADHIGS